MDIQSLLLIVFAFFCGGLPFGFWIAKWLRGIDIRNFGSGNIGFTNCMRVLKWGSVPVLILDIAKGYIPTFLGFHHFEGIHGEILGSICLVAAFFGHAYSWYFKIKEGKFVGGKSVATALGGVIALSPIVAFFATLIWMLTLIVTKYVSVASIISVWCAVIISLFNTGPVISGLLIITAFFITWTHRRNIERLIHHTERKAWGEEKVSVCGFLVHPGIDYVRDFQQTPILSWIPLAMERALLTDQDMRRFARKCFTIEVGEVNGIVTSKGLKGRILLFSLGLLPDQIENPANAEILTNMQKSATFLTRRRGSKVLGLGGLSSSFPKEGRGGIALQQWANERNKQCGDLDIAITNGGAYTVSATITALEKEAPKPLSELRVGVIGLGTIGSGVVRALKGRVAEIIAVARNIKQITDIEGIDELISSRELEKLRDVDVVITMTSSPTPIITHENAVKIFGNKAGVIFLDVAYPGDVSDHVRMVLPKCKIVRCGLIRLPGDNITSPVDFHFGHVIDPDGTKHPLVPACMAETLILALSGEYQRATRGAMIRPEDVLFFKQFGEEHGFEVIVSDKSEPAIYKGE